MEEEKVYVFEPKEYEEKQGDLSTDVTECVENDEKKTLKILLGVET